MTASRSGVEHAVTILRDGGLVGFPTETVYGLGADAANADALRRLFAVKRRPPTHPVIVHLGHAAQLDELGRDVPEVAHRLARAFWPGPLTVVVPRDATRIAAEAAGGLDTVGLRVPHHPVALALLTAFGAGIAAPSANRFGRVSPTTAAHVRADLGDDVDMVLDGGPCPVGVESTIVDCSHPDDVRILRVGGIPIPRIAALLGYTPALGAATRAPGTLAAHYAPTARVELVVPRILDARAAALRAEGMHVGLLAVAEVPVPEGVTALDAPRDEGHFARVLYSRLREADQLQVDVLLAIPPSDHGIGAAVLDRLQRAAAGGG